MEGKIGKRTVMEQKESRRELRSIQTHFNQTLLPILFFCFMVDYILRKHLNTFYQHCL